MEKVEGGNGPMTQKIWECWLRKYVLEGEVAQFNKLWNEYPDFAAHMIQEVDAVVSRSGTRLSKEETLASWEQLKVQLREEYGENFI